VATLLVNYADLAYFKAQKLNTRTGLKTGGLARGVEYGRQHIDAAFYARNARVLSLRGGAGRWLWKPYVVLKALREEMRDGDVLFYCDSGAHFVASAAPVIDLCVKQTEKPVIVFELAPDYLNREYVKRDCFYYMGMDRAPYPDMTHILASFLVMRKSPFALRFAEDWLRYAEDPRILTETPNTCGLPDYSGFIQHRFDQSILSLLARKYEVATVPDISQWGNERRPPEIPQIIQHTRWKE
jgi:hypothetical protein